MGDDVIRAFRGRVAREALKLRSESACVRLVADPLSGDPPSRYHGLLTGVEHFERGSDGVLRWSDAALPFSLEFPDDYCSCTDGSLQLRVARVHVPLAHPNLGLGGVVCLGPRFRPATRLRPLLEHLHGICASRVFASDSPLDPTAADFFQRHPERVRALRAEPLWIRPTAESVRIAPAAGPQEPR